MAARAKRSEQASCFLGVPLLPLFHGSELLHSLAENFLEYSRLEIQLLGVGLNTCREAGLERLKVKLVGGGIQIVRGLSLLCGRGLSFGGGLLFRLVLLEPRLGDFVLPLGEERREVERFRARLEMADLDGGLGPAVGQAIQVLVNFLDGLVLLDLG